MSGTSFQIYFNSGESSYSATFDSLIGLECKGSFVDVKGHRHYMKNWKRTVHPSSTPTNTIHVASMIGERSVPNMCQIDNCDYILKETFGATIGADVSGSCCRNWAVDKLPSLCAYCIQTALADHQYNSYQTIWNNNGLSSCIEEPNTSLWVISSQQNPEEIHIIDGLSIWSKLDTGPSNESFLVQKGIPYMDV